MTSSDLKTALTHALLSRKPLTFSTNNSIHFSIRFHNTNNTKLILLNNYYEIQIAPDAKK